MARGRESVCVERWLGRLAEATKPGYLRLLGLFLTYLGERGFTCDPEELIEYQKGALGDDRYVILDYLQEWVQGFEGVRMGTKRRKYSAVKSFFQHNRADLPRDPVFRLRADLPTSQGDFSFEELRALLSGCNRLYRAMLISMFMGGMGAGELIHWSNHGWDSFIEQIESGARFIRVDLPGRKMRRNAENYYTLLGRDARKALGAYLEERGREPGAIFQNQRGNPVQVQNINIYLRRHFRRLGSLRSQGGNGPGARYGKHPHELRDLFRTRWHLSGANALVAEFFMGHRVDPLGYNKAMRNREYVVSEYMKAEPWLNVLSEDAEKVSRREVKWLEEEHVALKEEMERYKGLEAVVRDLAEKVQQMNRERS